MLWAILLTATDEGQASGRPANALIEQIQADYILADKGYDGASLLITLKRQVQ
ncbi:MAG: hypothetical protein IPP22_00035 [Nitrosomonas sp.]|nr:hypothetical protein [Nitrosomonas sp.]